MHLQPPVIYAVNIKNFAITLIRHQWHFKFCSNNKTSYSSYPEKESNWIKRTLFSEVTDKSRLMSTTLVLFSSVKFFNRQTFICSLEYNLIHILTLDDYLLKKIPDLFKTSLELILFPKNMGTTIFWKTVKYSFLKKSWYPYFFRQYLPPQF